MMRAILLPCILLFAPFTAPAQNGWVQQPTPNPSPYRNILRGISGIDASDIWTVGNYQTSASPNVNQNLVLHWNGSAWAQHQVMNYSSNLNTLWDVLALGTNNVWAVGDYAGAGGSAQGQIHHWNGSAWSSSAVNFSSSSFFRALDASAPNDVWAVGGKAGIGPDTAFVYHFDGSNWTQRNAPPVGTEKNWFYDVSALAPDDVWAVGTYGMQPTGGFRHMAMHWDGNSWTNVPLPSLLISNAGFLNSVHMVASDDVWAAGEFNLGGGVIIHWDGSSWSVVEQTLIGRAFASLAPDDIHAFGADIIHWDGNNWSVADDLSSHPAPSLLSSTVLNDGGIWAAGTNVTGSFFSTLVYRRDADVNESVPVAVKAFLDGAFDSGTGLMRDDLRTQGLIPLQEPYSGMGFSISNGGATTTNNAILATTGSAAIVDWVLVELRSSIDPSEVLQRLTALIRRDGVIVAPDGGELIFPVAEGEYHVAVRHRNHLGTMTAQPVTLSNPPITIDLTQGSTTTWGVDGRKTIGTVRALWAGEVQPDGILKYAGSNNDRDPILSLIGGVVPTATVSGYYPEDVNMDGIVRYTGGNNDRDPILVNVGGVIPTATRAQQLP